jgi:hypothetical protein
MLRNLLSTPRTFTQIDEKDRRLQVKNDSWTYIPDTTKTAAYALNVDVRAAREVPAEVFTIARMPEQEPNVRYVETEKLHSMDTPLSCENRGVHLPGDLIQPSRRKPMLFSSHSYVDDGGMTVANFSVVNTLPSAMDLFMQKNMSIKCSVVPPFGLCVRHLSGVGLGEKAIDANVDDINEVDQDENTSLFLFATKRTGTITITGRQEIKKFTFDSRAKVGMEVEMWSGIKLSCSKVLPHTQAHAHEKALLGAEIISVNGRRVQTFEEFAFQMRWVRSQSKSDVVALQVASYRGGKGKLDDFILNQSKNAAVKSLFSKMLQFGIDNDHQHDVEVSSGEEESDEDDVNDENEGSEVTEGPRSRSPKAATPKDKSRKAPLFKKMSTKKKQYYYDSDDEEEEAAVGHEKKQADEKNDKQKHADEEKEKDEQEQARDEEDDRKEAGEEEKAAANDCEDGKEGEPQTEDLVGEKSLLSEAQSDYPEEDGMLASRSKRASTSFAVPVNEKAVNGYMPHSTCSTVRSIEMEATADDRTQPELSEPSQIDDAPTQHNNTTEIDQIPFMALVCVPESLQKSNVSLPYNLT